MSTCAAPIISACRKQASTNSKATLSGRFFYFFFTAGVVFAGCSGVELAVVLAVVVASGVGSGAGGGGVGASPVG